jgi:SAM-dependent methyltransferase
MEQPRDKFERSDGCPVCASKKIDPYKKGTFDYALLNMEQIKITDSEYGKIWDLDRCRDCGHIFANPTPKPEFIRSLYSQVEDPAYDLESEGRSQNFIGILRVLGEMRPARGALFDVGAATGILLRLAREQGWTADGIEASDWAVAYAAKKYGIRVLQGFFEETNEAAGPYQAVTMIDFIEHTPKPGDAIRKACAILAPGGIVCLVTPDIHSVAARLAGKRWWHLRPGHLAYFSARSLETLLAGAGFKIVKKKRYAWTFSLYYLLSRKKFFNFLTRKRRLVSFFGKIRIKLALGDSFEIYAIKEPRG